MVGGAAAVSAHRTFPLDCDLPGSQHVVGDRHVEDGQVVDELTAAGTWAPVCPVDDVPLTGRDGAGWLMCPACRRTPKELAEVTR